MKPVAPALRMVLAVVAVTALHWAGLTWLQAQMPLAVPLVQMKDPLFTRLLEPESPPATPLAQSPTVRPSRDPKARRDVLTAVQLESPAPPAPTPALPPLPPFPPVLPAPFETSVPVALPEAPSPPDHSPPVIVTAAEVALPEPAPTLPASAPNVQADANANRAQTSPSPPGERPAPPDTWPPDTRLSYNLSGFFRGELHGSARVQWQRDAPSATTLANQALPSQRYQVRFDLGATGITLMTMTSQGEVTPNGLMPRVYEEKLPNGLRRATFDGGFVKFQDGSQAPLPPQVQDTASQFVELSHRFSTGQASLKVGNVIQVWLARPGGMDLWTYDVVKEESLQTARLGAIAAFHLRPRPLANPRGSIYPELWFAPSLQYLPVRVRINTAGPDFVDLLVDQIEQSGVADVPSRRP